MIYSKKTAVINTLFFILGISVIFFVLGNAAISLGIIINSHIKLFSIIAGITVIIFGFFQLGFIKLNFLNNEKSLIHKFNPNNMNILKSFILGLFFSFSWSPCIGVTLSSVLLVASTSGTMLYGNLLIFIYTIGLSIPFLIISLFATCFLNLFKNKGIIIKLTSILGGIILIIMGILIILGMQNFLI